jgi:uncharacterized protein
MIVKKEFPVSTDIREKIFEIPLFDDHEHLTPLPDLAKEPDSYESIAGYAIADLLVSMGIQSPGSSPFPEEPGRERDKVFFSAWRKARNTGYCRAIERACRDILGLDYTEENADAIGERLHEMKGGDPGTFSAEILGKRAGIRWAIHDSINRPGQAAEGQFPPFVYVNYRDDPLLAIANRDAILDREALWKRSIHTLDQLVDGLMDSITACLATRRVTSFKIGLAYNRDLDFGFPCKADAERAFNRMMVPRGGEKVLRRYERFGERGNSPAIPQSSGSELRPLHDYLVHVYIQRAQAEGKPVQIHTGYLAGTNGDLRNVNPMQLVPLFLHYQTVKFDLFHAGWPYTDEMGTIGKQYPNVWLSMCWAWAMNPITMHRTLDAWLDGVPYNKIIGFGGDTHHPIASYGYAMQAREGIARVLEARISRGDMDPLLAEEVAQAVLFDNGCGLHGLPADQ